MSDLHVGEGLFRPELLTAAIQETNELGPELVVVAGDLTMEGYRGEFEACERFLAELDCGHVVVAMGNHDARNVGYRHFEDFFGAREGCRDRLHQTGPRRGGGGARALRLARRRAARLDGGTPDRRHPPSHPR